MKLNYLFLVVAVSVVHTAASKKATTKAAKVTRKTVGLYLSNLIQVVY